MVRGAELFLNLFSIFSLNIHQSFNWIKSLATCDICQLSWPLGPSCSLSRPSFTTSQRFWPPSNSSIPPTALADPLIALADSLHLPSSYFGLWLFLACLMAVFPSSKANSASFSPPAAFLHREFSNRVKAFARGAAYAFRRKGSSLHTWYDRK